MIIPSEFNWYFHNFFSLLLWIIYRGATDENLNFDISFRRVWSTQNKQFLNNFAHFLSGYFQIWEIVNSNRRFAFCWNVIQFHMSLFWLHFGLFREFSESGTKLYFPANSSKTNYIIDRFAVRPNSDHVGKQQNTNLNGPQVVLSWLLKSTTFASKNLSLFQEVYMADLLTMWLRTISIDQNHGRHFWFTSLWPGGHVGGQSPQNFLFIEIS